MQLPWLKKVCTGYNLEINCDALYILVSVKSDVFI